MLKGVLIQRIRLKKESWRNLRPLRGRDLVWRIFITNIWSLRDHVLFI